jgi:two-component system, chemotaxis family, protein-glutamate methylesterase/glutaminase
MSLSVKKTIRVLVVDDSAIVRKVLTKQLNAADGIEVVGTAPDPYVARNKIVSLKPDVLTLDIEMPRMDGITFMRKLMKHHPMPIIILSSLTPQGSQTAVEALALGAVDVICKPNAAYSVNNACDELVQKIRIAANAQFKAAKEVPAAPVASTLHMSETTHKVLALGASTGGVQALTTVLAALPATCPGVVIVQHMPAKFTTSFSARLDQQCAVSVKEAHAGDRIVPGKVLIAPGGYHMRLRRSGATYYVDISDGPLVCRQKPSVDVLFESVADYAGKNAVGAILTGMGDDGARGLLKMRQHGARTLAQDEASCVVFGMPAQAIECGAAEKVVPLNRVAETLIQLSGCTARSMNRGVHSCSR